jgi:RNA polymerase sigma-70 factor, ECF subfamily
VTHIFAFGTGPPIPPLAPAEAADPPIALDTSVRARQRGELAALYPELLRLAAAAGHGLLPAEDLVQEAMARAIAREKAGPGIDDLGSYLRRIVMNTCRSEMRRKFVRRSAAPKLASDGSHTDSYPSDLDAVLTALGPVDRALLLLTVIDGLSTQEAAEQIGVKAPAARKRLSRAKQRIRQQLEEADQHER